MSLSHSTDLLERPEVADLIAQGARAGTLSYAAINDLLIDLELDEDDVELLFETLEGRAIRVVDETAKPEKTASSTKSKPKKSDGHDDLDGILAELESLEIEDDPDSVAAFLSEELAAEEAAYAGEDIDDSQAPVADALKIYLNRMGEVPRLSTERERELALIARDGSVDEARAAKNDLVESNLRLVVHLAHAAAPRTTLSLTDLLQEGNLGLLDAVERYRPESTKTFGAYATWWVRRAMNRAINEHSRVVRLSGELYDAIQKMQVAQRQLSQTLSRAPSREEIAQASGLSIAQIEEAQRAAARPLSLDAPVGSEDDVTEFGELISDPESEVVGAESDKRELREGIDKLLEDLSEREHAVLAMRFGLGDNASEGPRSAEDVAKAMNLSRERVHELETRALRKLRKKAKGAGLDQLLGDAPDVEE